MRGGPGWGEPTIRVVIIPPAIDADLEIRDIPGEPSAAVLAMCKIAGDGTDVVMGANRVPGRAFMYGERGGKGKRRVTNVRATMLADDWRPGFAQRDIIVGTVIIGGTILGGDYKDCPQEVIDFLAAKWPIKKIALS